MTELLRVCRHLNPTAPDHTEESADASTSCTQDSTVPFRRQSVALRWQHLGGEVGNGDRYQSRALLGLVGGWDAT
jgi:hypothetical protein